MPAVFLLATACLRLIWAAQREASVRSEYVSTNFVLTLRTSSIDNNDGISVIDVTDPEIPSYCFVSVLGIEADPVPYRVPLSAEEYVRAYYPKYVPPVKAEAEETEEMTTQHRHSLAVEEDLQVTIAKLKDVKLVEPWMLAEAWSAEYKEVSGNTEKAPEAVMEPVKSEIPSLVDLTIPLLAAHAIPSGETADIEAMVWMPDKRSAIKAVLRQLSPFPEGGMSLLKKVIGQELEKHNAQLDLSGFALSSAQLEALIPAMSIDVVNLSDMPAVTIDAVRHILTKLPQLKRLILFECPSISSDDIYSLLSTEPGLFNRLDALIHPCLFGELKDTEDLCPYHNAFSYIGAHSRGLKACSLPFFTPSRVIQALIDILGPLCDEYGAYSFWTTSLAMQAAFSSVRAHGQKWSERDTVIIPQLSLRALKGEGWTFAIRTDLYNEDNRAFAFIRIKSDPPTMGDEELHKIKGMEGSDAISAPMNASAWEIHDLASFVNQVTLHGKPRPTDDAVNELQKILTTLQTTQNMPLMGDQDVPRFFGDVKKAIGHLY